MDNDVVGRVHGNLEPRPHVAALSAGAGIILVIVVAALMLARGAVAAVPGYSTSIQPGLSPAWTADQAANQALREIARNEQVLGHRLVEPRIRSVAAVSGATASARVGNSAVGALPVVWIVEADGTFVSYFGRAGVEPPSATNGYLLFDDQGSLVGSGFPI